MLTPAQRLFEWANKTAKTQPMKDALEVIEEKDRLFLAIETAYQSCNDPRTIKILRDALNQD